MLAHTYLFVSISQYRQMQNTKQRNLLAFLRELEIIATRKCKTCLFMILVKPIEREHNNKIKTTSLVFTGLSVIAEIYMKKDK